jgi:hypothetical protein
MICGPDVTEHARAPEIILIEVAGKFGGAGPGKTSGPGKKFKQEAVFVTHDRLLM